MHEMLGKSNDKGKIVKAEAALGRFKLELRSGKPPWLLSKEDVKVANQRLKHILIPVHLDFNPQYLFSCPNLMIGSR